MHRFKTFWTPFILLILACTLYRVWEGRPGGFAPQIAMALFAGAVVTPRGLAFFLPLLSMFLSDALYQLLYTQGLSSIPGFYEGQWVNYLLFAAMTVFGFMARNLRLPNIALAAVSAPTAYFLLSNFFVWVGGGGYGRAKTMEGLIECYVDALPFYRNSLIATALFSIIFFGVYLFTRTKSAKTALISVE